MAEKQGPKKKRGRPRKNPTPIVNEEKTVVTMSQSNHKPTKQEIDNGVGSVRDSLSVTQVTIDGLENRWKSLFSKYANLGIENIISTINTNGGLSSLNNPFIQNRRVKQISTTPLKITKDELNDALVDPENHEQVLRSLSSWLSYTNYVYQNLIQLNRDTAKYFYYANPLYLDGYNKTKLKDDSVRVDKILKKFNVASTFKDIASQVFIEGKCSYLVRTSYDKKDINYLLLQKLNSDNVKITGFGSKQKFIVSFNMVLFLQPGYSTEQYPQFIQDTWQAMLDSDIIVVDKKGKKKLNPKANLPEGHMLETLIDGSYVYWVQLPQDLAITFYTNGANPNSLPDSTGLFNDLLALDDYRWLQGSLVTKGVNAIMTAEVPMAYQPKSGADQTSLSPDVILGYQDLFSSTISENILPFFGPFENFKLHELAAQPEALEVVYSQIKQLIAASGNSALLTVSDKPSISSVQTARMIQESKADYLTKQFESFLNNIINENFDLNYQWHITLHGGIFNWREDAKMTKEIVLQGTKALLPRLLSYYDMSIEDCHGTNIYLKDLDIKLLSEEKEEQQLIASAESNPVGRPPLGADQVQNDNTGASKDSGTNDSEIKEYELELLKEQLDELE